MLIISGLNGDKEYRNRQSVNGMSSTSLKRVIPFKFYIITTHVNRLHEQLGITTPSGYTSGRDAKFKVQCGLLILVTV